MLGSPEKKIEKAIDKARELQIKYDTGYFAEIQPASSDHAAFVNDLSEVARRLLWQLLLACAFYELRGPKDQKLILSGLKGETAADASRFVVHALASTVFVDPPSDTPEAVRAGALQAIVAQIPFPGNQAFVDEHLHDPDRGRAAFAWEALERAAGREIMEAELYANDSWNASYPINDVLRALWNKYELIWLDVAAEGRAVSGARHRQDMEAHGFVVGPPPVDSPQAPDEPEQPSVPEDPSVGTAEPAPSAFCGQCGAASRPADAFCRECGASLA